MADSTHIEWTDATWNIVTGCSVVSPGCTNCYAMRLAGTRLQHHPSRAGLTIATKAGPVWNGQVRFNAGWLTQPLRWTRPRMIFVAAHGDVFHEGVTDHQLDMIFGVMAVADWHVFQILTKRPERMRAYLTQPGFALRHNWPLQNVWLGVSVEDQARADERIPLLLDTPAAVRWISAEPLLGPIDLTMLCDGNSFWSATHGLRYHDVPDDTPPYSEPKPKLDWVVAGGESGPGTRPMHPDWARHLRDQCAAAGVPFLFKQWGSWAPRNEWAVGSGAPPMIAVAADGGRVSDDIAPQDVGGHRMAMVGKKAAGRLLDGVLHDGFPEARS